MKTFFLTTDSVRATQTIETQTNEMQTVVEKSVSTDSVYRKKYKTVLKKNEIKANIPKPKINFKRSEIFEDGHKISPLFPSDSLIKSVKGSKSFGIIPNPKTYNIQNDSFISVSLIFCFIIALIAFSKSKNFVLRQLKSIFHPPKGAITQINETSSEIKFQIFLAIQTCLMLAIITFYLVLSKIPLYNSEQRPYTYIIVLFVFFSIFLLIKFLIQATVNAVFFSRKQNYQWNKIQLISVSLEGVLFFPIVLGLTYLNMPINSAIISVFCIIFFVKLIVFYRCYCIFFSGNKLFFHIILYLCTLELMPIIVLIGSLNAFLLNVKVIC